MYGQIELMTEKERIKKEGTKTGTTMGVMEG